MDKVKKILLHKWRKYGAGVMWYMKEYHNTNDLYYLIMAMKDFSGFYKFTKYILYTASNYKRYYKRRGGI